MSQNTSYLELAGSPTRIRNYLGLKMDAGTEFKQGKNRLYIELPVKGVDTEDGFIQEVKRNQHVFLLAPATLSIKGMNIFEIEPNPALAELGQVQGSYKIHPDSGEKQIGIWFTARKDIDLTKLDYLVRIYMVA